VNEGNIHIVLKQRSLVMRQGTCKGVESTNAHFFCNEESKEIREMTLALAVLKTATAAIKLEAAGFEQPV
jgi:hypothetical protein